MDSSLSRWLKAPFSVWRTVMLTFVIGALVAVVSRSAIAVMCATLACAFVFSAYERRYWLRMPRHHQMRDVALRFGLALTATYVLSATQFLAILEASFV
jgi:hypothetical protein